MCCCAKFLIKYILIIANLLFFIVGTSLLVLGILGLSVLSDIIDVLSFIEAIPVLIASVGAVVMVISFFGCCGAAKQNKCMLYFYAGLMLIIVALKIWIATEIFRNLSNMQEWVSNALEDIFGAPDVFSVFEVFFSCCGTSGPEAYPHNQIPSTCCPNDIQVCTIDNSFAGCNDIVADYFDSFGAIIGVIIIGTICAEIIAVVFAITIANFQKKIEQPERRVVAIHMY